ncbi:p25-alpha-domain-containing protein [Pelagophyceae sp. CCMP2097]|nr:p25-alpha-domain-containing protein [Pelagophyceae sp. CCMP2097]
MASFGGAGLRASYDVYCAFGEHRKVSSTAGLNSKNFYKMCKDAGLLGADGGKKLTSTTIDLAFTKNVGRGQNKLTWTQFLAALEGVAVAKRATVESVHAAISRLEQPVLTNATSVESVRFHDDPGTYTGVHKAGGPTCIDHSLSLEFLLDRSDADVRGVKKGPMPAPRAAVRPRSAAPAAAAAPAARPCTAQAPPRPPRPSPAAVEAPRVVPRETRHPAAAAPLRYARGDAERRGVPEPGGGPCVRRGVPEPGDWPCAASAASVGGGGIFDRLTDASQYTGAHKQRFDGAGHGRGLAGRDSTAKGGAAQRGAAHGYEGNTNTRTDTIYHDSSQFLMR